MPTPPHPHPHPPVPPLASPTSRHGFVVSSSLHNERKMTHALREPWPIEYASEHAELIREKEQQRRDFNFQSPQSQHRRHLVAWIRLRSEKLKLCTCTVHLAIYILDIFMDNFSIDLERLHLVALVCLQIAAKYEERDLRIPKVVQLNAAVNYRYKLEDFHHLEIMVLSFLDCNLNLPTAAHFAEYYSLFAVTRKDWDPTEYISYETFWQEAQRAVKDYLDLSLLDLNMIEYFPSAIACACILLARQQLRLACKWTDELMVVTKYYCDNITECANAILSRSTIGMDRKRKLVDSPDMGYATGGSNNSTPHKRRILYHGEDSNS